MMDGVVNAGEDDAVATQHWVKNARLVRMEGAKGFVKSKRRLITNNGSNSECVAEYRGVTNIKKKLGHYGCLLFNARIYIIVMGVNVNAKSLNERLQGMEKLRRLLTSLLLR